MPDQNTHRFMIFQRTAGHCHISIVRAASLRDALVAFAVKQFSVEIHKDGSLRFERGERNKFIYSHPLELIEAEFKANDRYSGLVCQDRNRAYLR